jgi:radical SAM protein with 4Fe4S-binding SPASM domain
MLSFWQDILILVCTMLGSLLFLAALNRVWPQEKRRVHNDLIGWQLGILGTTYAVILGFMLYTVWTSFGEANLNVDLEANALRNMYRLAQGMPQPQRMELETEAREYAEAVIDVFPCVQFPLPSGNLRRQKFLDIWNHSPELNDVRSIRAKDLPVCSTCSHVGTCTRCPGLAYVEGNMRGPSTADCEKSFQRTGIRSANMLRLDGAEHPAISSGPLIHIQPLVG